VKERPVSDLPEGEELYRRMRNWAAGDLRRMAGVGILIDTHTQTLAQILDDARVRMRLHVVDEDLVAVDWTGLRALLRGLGDGYYREPLHARGDAMIWWAVELADPQSTMNAHTVSLDDDRIAILMQGLARHRGWPGRGVGLAISGPDQTESSPSTVLCSHNRLEGAT
jgi:hypothetical protein